MMMMVVRASLSSSSTSSSSASFSSASSSSAAAAARRVRPRQLLHGHEHERPLPVRREVALHGDQAKVEERSRDVRGEARLIGARHAHLRLDPGRVRRGRHRDRGRVVDVARARARAGRAASHRGTRTPPRCRSPPPPRGDATLGRLRD
eukprot:31340-Pelagococcus_subviridis.AAC.5